MAEVASMLVRISADTSGFDKGIDTVSSKLSQAGESMTSTGKKLTAFATGPIVGLGAAITKVGMDFESQMARVQAISGATGEELQTLEEVARELGATTEFSATQAAGGLEFFARAGFDVEESIAALPATLDLTTASQMDLARAADITSDIMGGFGIQAEEATRVADILAATAAAANTDVEMLGQAMKFAAPVARDLGFSIEESSAAIGLMSDAGIKAGQAGRTLRTMMARLASDSGQVGGMLEQLGVEITNTAGEMLPMSEIIDRLSAATEDMTDAQRTATLEQIAGRQAVSGLSVLLEQGGDALAEFTGELENSSGAAQEQAGIMRDTLAGSLQALWSAVQEVALVFFEQMAPALETAIEWATKLARWFGELDPQMAQLILIAGGLVAALGPLLIIAGKIATAVAALTPVFSALGGALALLSGPAGAILLVVGALGVFIATNEEFREALFNVARTVRDTAVAAIEFLAKKYEYARDIIANISDTMVRIVTNTVDTIKELFIGRFADIAGSIKDFAGNALDTFRGFATNLVGGSIIPEMVYNVTNNFDKMNKESTSKVNNLTDAVISTFNSFAGTFENSITGVVDRGINLFDNFQRDAEGTIKKLAVNALANFTPLPRGVSERIVEMSAGVIKNLFAFEVDWVRIWNGMKNTVLGIWDSMTSGVRRAVDAILAPVRRMTDAVSGAWDSIRGALGFGSPDLLTRTFQSIADSARQASGQVDRSMMRMGMSIGDVTGIGAGQNGGFTGNEQLRQPTLRDISISQTVNGGDPAEIQRATRRALRRVARDWGIEDGRLL